MKPCRYLWKLKAELALSARSYGVPAGEGCCVPPQYALTKERQEMVKVIRRLRKFPSVCSLSHVSVCWRG